MASSFKSLRVWQDAMEFTVNVYHATAQFPRHELYGLTQQLRRAAVSVPSNIAEGKGHRSAREFANFLLHARGSLLEVQTQLMIAEQLQYLSRDEANRLQLLSDAIGRSLNSLINSMRGNAHQAKGQQLATND